MPYNPDRMRPVAFLSDGQSYRADRPVVLASTRGDMKIGPGEAVELAADLLDCAARLSSADEVSAQLLAELHRRADGPAAAEVAP